MRFARVGEVGVERPVAVQSGVYFDLSPLTNDIDGDFLESGVDRARKAMESGILSPLERQDVRIGAPIARPSVVVCIGMNYAGHAAESGSAPPTNLVVFNKAPNTLVGPCDQVVIPRNSEKTDWEVELGVVLGRRTTCLATAAEAAGCVGGYVLANDMSERTWQLETSGGQWGKGKSAPGFCPLGPWLVTPDELDPGDLRLRSWVNGEPRQDSTTGDLIFGIEQIIFELSQVMTLEAGDLILTGTPEGVALSGRFAYLKPGDLVEMEIDGLGNQRVEMV